MSNCFKLPTTREIVSRLAPLSDVLPQCDKYFAHMRANKQTKELLEEHIDLTGKYLCMLVEVNKLDTIIDEIICLFVTDCDYAVFLKRLFVKAIMFHDHGKINENFQVVRMGNQNFRANDDKLAHHHALLGSYIFIGHSFKEADFFIPDDDKKNNILYGVILLFAQSIGRHHAKGLQSVNTDFLPDLEFFIDELCRYLRECNLAVDINIEKMQGCYSNVFNRIHKEDYFYVWQLVKLNYSLLTAADYYATNHFMNGLEDCYDESDFGIIDASLRSKLFENFMKLKPYNAELWKRHSYFLNYPIQNLQETSNTNLNILRQRLGAEVLAGITKFKDQRIFYIEVPTAGGKTNLSVIMLIKLLMIYQIDITKVFYIFPFTTLSTQIQQGLQETLGLSNNEIIAEHSKSGYHESDEEEEKNDIDNLFVSYPFCLLSHVKFFDIIKTCQRKENYLFHRLANSVVIIDELQYYTPSEWDKLTFFINKFAKTFNIRFILMSATLPKIDGISISNKMDFVNLIDNAKENYFLNPNFCNRVRFDLSLLKKYSVITHKDLADEVLKRSSEYEKEHGRVHAAVEFITKKSATKFCNYISKSEVFKKVFILSGTILETRRREVLKYISDPNHANENILLITTQVIEAGIDIDMDIGFKNISLVDSDIQFAGRINRNMLKATGILYLFQLDKPEDVYREDPRCKICKSIYGDLERLEKVLGEHDFEYLYRQVINDINAKLKQTFTVGFRSYMSEIELLNFEKIDADFKLIDNDTISVFIPISLPLLDSEGQRSGCFSESELEFLKDNNCLSGDMNRIEGRGVWELYKSVVERKKKNITRRRRNTELLKGIMSKFIISLYNTSAIREKLEESDKKDYLFNGIGCLKDLSMYDYCLGLNETL